MFNLGDNLKQLRQKIGLRQEDVAKMVGVERSTLANWERGAKQPGLEILVKLSQLFGVSLNELVGLNNDQVHTPLTQYYSLISDPVVKLLSERTGVPARNIAAFISAFTLPEDTSDKNDREF
ncbi:XRE family transcriptional regulator [Thermoanaerobacteraceae bacterium SP2]|jgi:transcriptional regulator with XRE-family HTH domain|nr:XRE family transcriptional regulator [Thermoanaerobacteraceae bacterium SP2]